MKQEILKFYYTSILKMQGYREWTMTGKIILPQNSFCKTLPFIWRIIIIGSVVYSCPPSVRGDDVSCKLSEAYISIIIQLFIENKLFNVNNF